MTKLSLVIISELGEELERTNSSQKDNLEELQERMDNMADIQTQIREEASLEQADMSQQIVELRNKMISSNAALQNLDLHEQKMAELLENCKGTAV